MVAIVRRRGDTGAIMLDFLFWKPVTIPVPGAIVTGMAFTLAGGDKPVTDVEAWRCVPTSWLAK